MDVNPTLPAPPSSSSARPQDELPPASKRFKSEEPAPGDAGANGAKHAGCPDDGRGDEQSGGNQPAVADNALSTGVSEKQCKPVDAPPIGQGQPCVPGELPASSETASSPSSPSTLSPQQGEPTKPSPGQQGGLSLPQRPGVVVPPSASAAGGQESHSDDGSDSSLDDGDQAALLAALLQGGLQGEQADFIRAYLARHTDLLEEGPPRRSIPKPPTFLEMADFINSDMCQSIVVLAGAGISVSSGIPDFRSANTGLYDTLRPELLTASELDQALIGDDPTLALDKGMFLENPLPCLELKRSFILGTQERRWRATLAHRFVEMLHTKLGKLTRWYTQNIDGLELQTSIPREKIVNVHGSMGAAACEVCGAEMDFGEFCSKIRTNIKDISGDDAEAPSQSTPIDCPRCNNPTMKPTIVLFRSSLPKEFHVRCQQDLPECDLLIIMGTSLTVAPANSLVYRVPMTSLRLVMNNEMVGRRLGIDYEDDSVRDVWASGNTDQSCLDLSERLGWLDDLATMADELPESSADLLRKKLAQRTQSSSCNGNDTKKLSDDIEDQSLH